MLTIVVPEEDWATVEITDPTGREPLHNNTHTLICSVIANPGLHIRPVVHWYHPDGSQVQTAGRVREGKPVTDGLETKLSLTFDPVLHDDGGNYTCLAKVDVPWMSTEPQNGSYLLVVTSKTSYKLTQDFDTLLPLSLYT